MSSTSRAAVLPNPEAVFVPRSVVVYANDYPTGHAIAPHRHERGQLVYACDGTMTVTVHDDGDRPRSDRPRSDRPWGDRPWGDRPWSGQRWVVPPDRAVWVPAGVRHSIAVSHRVRMRSLYILPERAPDLPASCRVAAVTPLLRELILRATELPRLYDEAGWPGRLIAVLLDELRRLPSVPLDLPQPTEPRLQRVTEALLADPADGRSLAAWARQAGASPRTLARLFLRETGLSFGAWRQRARLLQAVARLAAGQAVTAVALDVGYDSPSAFIAAFRRTFGTTPRRYLRPDRS